MKFKVLVVGCGNMGAALAAGCARAHPDATVVALDKDPARAADRLGGSAVTVHRAPGDIRDFQPDIVILALKPQVLGAALAELRRLCDAALVISIAAGTPIAQLQSLLGDHRRVVRAMPNLPVQVGEGMTTLFAPALAAGDRAATEAVFMSVGAAAWVASEAQIDAATAIAGSGPAYFFAMVEHLAAAGVAEGLPAGLAEQLARQTCVGSAALLAADTRPAAALKAAVCSPGGTTEAGLAAMQVRDAGGTLSDILAAGVAAAHRRARELARLAHS